MSDHHVPQVIHSTPLEKIENILKRELKQPLFLHHPRKEIQTFLRTLEEMNNSYEKLKLF
jgi:hypothetical protein